MSFVGLALMIGAAAATENGNPPPPPVSITIVAVHASHDRDAKAQRLDPGLESVRPALEGLPFTSYRLVNTATVSAAFNRETTVQITHRYTLGITPESREPNGQVRVNVRIQMVSREPGKPPVNAVTSKVTISPGKQFSLRGLRHEEGELIVVIALKG